jgi:UDPglucose 6-dehydrogenase
MLLVSEIIDRPDVSLIYNPEFLSEGSAVRDFFEPDRLVVGGTSVEAIEKFVNINSQLNTDTEVMSWGAAEILKLASNAFLATRVTLVNEIEAICRKQGVSFKQVAEGLSKDKRIGTAYLAPGPGWGGSCLPKDVAGLVQHSKAAGNPAILLEAVIRSNRERMLGVVDLVENYFASTVASLSIAILGRAFKAGTDDIRESPALAIAKEFVKRGHRVNSFDPVAEPIEIEGLQCTDSALDAINGSDAIVVATEWPEFGLIPPEIAIGKMNQDLVVDTRSILDPASWSNHTKNFISFG